MRRCLPSPKLDSPVFKGRSVMPDGTLEASAAFATRACGEIVALVFGPVRGRAECKQ